MTKMYLMLSGMPVVVLNSSVALRGPKLIVLVGLVKLNVHNQLDDARSALTTRGKYHSVSFFG